jgi:hypothetical protein
MMDKIVYKVCKEVDGKFYSGNPSKEMILHDIDPSRGNHVPYVLEYVIGKVTVPNIPGSKIFVFNTIEDARRWCGGIILRDRGHVLLECNAESISEIIDIPMLTLDHEEYAGFWTRYNLGMHPLEDSCYGIETPAGTLFAGKVTPIKTVTIEEW